MFNQQKMQNIKQGAYFDYFKMMSTNTAQTIRKLELTFNNEFSQNFQLNPNILFKRIKTLLNSYEILILEINDSCEFVEVPQFGVCILKIFYQMMSIIKFMGRKVIEISTDNKPSYFEREKRDQRYTLFNPTPIFKEQNKEDIMKAKEREKFRIKELSKHIFKDVNNQIREMEEEQKFIDLENEQTYLKISQGRQKVQTIQTSQSEAILTETMSMLNKKGEYITNFLNMKSHSLTNATKEINNNAENYQKIVEIYEKEIQSKLEIVKNKFRLIMEQQVIQNEQKKKLSMQSVECQTKIPDEKEDVKHLKKNSHNEQIKRLKNDLKYEQDQVKSLKDLLKSKVNSFQEQIMKLKVEKMKLESKAQKTPPYLGNQRPSQKYLSGDRMQFSSVFQNTNKIDTSRQLKLNPLNRTKSNHKKSQIINRSNNQLDQNFYDLDIDRNVISIKMVLEKQISKFNKTFSNRRINTKKDIKILPDLDLCRNMINLTISANFRNNYNQQIQTTQLSSKISSVSFKTQTKVTPIKEAQEHNQQIFQNEVISNLKKTNSSILEAQKSIKSIKQSHIDEEEREKQLSNRFQKVNKNHQIKPFFTEQQNNLTQSNDKKFISQNKIKTIQKFTIPPKQSSNNSSFNNLFKKQKNSNEQFEKQLNNNQNNKTILNTEKINKQYKVKINTQYIKNKIEQTDINLIYISQENAKNYELINLNAVKPKFSPKTHQQKWIVSTMRTSQKSKNLDKISFQSDSDLEYLIMLAMRQLNVMKHHSSKEVKRHYIELQNFIKFPFSSRKLRNQAKWKESEDRDGLLSYSELKKLVKRIVKLHVNCNNQSDFKENCNENIKFCEHLKNLFSKFGISIEKIGNCCQ